MLLVQITSKEAKQMDLTETKLYGINEEENWCKAFYAKDTSELLERGQYFKTNKDSKVPGTNIARQKRLSVDWTDS